MRLFKMLFFPRLFSRLVGDGMPSPLTDKQFLELEIQRWKFSPLRVMQLDGERYYNGDHDILGRRRTAIGEGGELQEVHNLPNNRIVDNQYSKMVDQKTNYLLSKPITFESGSDSYDAALKSVFNASFLNKLKNGGRDALNGGLFWLYVYYNERGELSFQKFRPFEILPFWKDAEHTDLDCAVRLYQVEGYEGTQYRIYEKVEVYSKAGVQYYDLENGRLIEDINKPMQAYAYMDGKPYNWERIPLVAFKYNEREMPLIKRVKCLQDALNVMESDLLNNMQEDSRNTILIIKNYDGTNLSEFRRNLSVYGAVKVRSADGENGGVETLKIDVNASNYELVLKTIKKAIVENAMGYDAKDDRIGANANQINIKSMYCDIDLDADNMESEFQASFEQLLFFVRSYLATKGAGNYQGDIKITFNRDMMINESETIDNLVKLGVQLPNELLVGQVPFVDDVKQVMKMLDEEKQQNDPYANAFVGQGNNDMQQANQQQEEINA